MNLKNLKYLRATSRLASFTSQQDWDQPRAIWFFAKVDLTAYTELGTYERKMLEDRIVQTAWINRRVFSMPSGWALVKFANCFHTGGGGGGDVLATLIVLVVVTAVFCGVAILIQWIDFPNIPLSLSRMLIDPIIEWLYRRKTVIDIRRFRR